MNLNVLIVDDSEMVHQRLKDYISKIDIESDTILTHSCYSFEEFKGIFSPGSYALVITDLFMERETSGIDVINHVRHSCYDEKTRIMLITDYPQKVPGDLLTREYDVNGYIEKSAFNPITVGIAVKSLLKSYKDIVTFENAIKTVDDFLISQQSLPIVDMVRELMYQIRSFLSIKEPNMKLEVSAKLDNEVVFEFEDTEQKSKMSSKFFEIDLLGNNLQVCVYSSRPLSHFEEEYIITILNSLKYSIAYSELSNIQNEVVLKLSNVIEIRSGETAQHVKRVGEITYLLSKEYGMDEKYAQMLKIASSLHDVGKIGIPDNILKKPERLSAEEFAIMKEHPLIGFELLKNSRWKLFELGALISLQHHERWDGAGYPYGLKGQEIAPEARIVQVADVFEALTHDRCYRPAWSIDRAVEYMHDMSGKQFDPDVIEIFKKRLWDILDIFKKLKD